MSETMRVLMQTSNGPPTKSLTVLTLPKPVLSHSPDSSDLLIRVHCSSIAPTEYGFLLGYPQLIFGVFPLPVRHGIDFSGVVEDLGEGAKSEGWSVGDEVVGALPLMKKGAMAEYLLCAASDCARKPKNLTHEEAACLPSNALTAYQPMVLHEGAKDVAFITGGLGGVSHLALQLAKNHFGFERIITTVSTSKVEQIKSQYPWVDVVIDYKTVDPLKIISKGALDLVVDTLGKPAGWLPYLNTSHPSPTLVEILAIPSASALESSWGCQFSWFRRYFLNAVAWFLSPRVPKGVKYVPQYTTYEGKQLREVMAIAERGDLKPMAAKVFSLDEAAEAYELADKGVTMASISTSSSNTSFVLRGINDVVFEQKPIPDIADDEVLVEVKKTGICGSDVHFLTHGHIGDFWVRAPMVLGHESAGIVAKVGKNVHDLKPGQKVALEPGMTCRKCHACKSGRYELCPHIVFAATPPTDGTLAKWYKVPSDLAYALPDTLDLEDGAMMEPLSVAVHGAHTIARVSTGQTVAVFGCGPVGLLLMAVARVLGAARILAVDIQPSRLAFAKEYAGAETYLPPKMDEGESRVEYSKRCARGICELMGWGEGVVSAFGEGGADTVLEATGSEVCIQTGVFIARRGGVFTQVGMGSDTATIPITTALVKELQIRGSFRYGYGDYPLAISFAASHKIDLKPLVTHRFKFEDAVEAFEATKNGKDKQGKWVIKTLIDGPE